jgi:hypothetical protein
MTTYETPDSAAVIGYDPGFGNTRSASMAASA